MNNAYPGTPTTCTGTPPYQCIEWAASTTIDVYLSSSLLQNIDLRTDTRAAMTEWNAAPANNPTFHEITTLTEDLYVGSYPLPDGVYASTSITSQGSAPYRITYTHTTFNSEVVWNRSLDFHVANPEPGTYIYHADARKVANHELGHAQGLGHTGNTAVMHQGPTTYFHLQADDKTGIAAVYP